MSARRVPDSVKESVLPATSNVEKPPDPDNVVPRWATVMISMPFVAVSSPAQLALVTSSIGSVGVHATAKTVRAKQGSNRRVMVLKF